MQTSRRCSVGWRAGLVALLMAVFAAGVGWHVLHHRGQPEAADQDIHPAQAAGPATRIDANYNVLLVSIDTCRSDRLSCYGYKRPTTPNIDAVAKDGAMFKTAMTPVPLTTPAHSSMLTGTYPPTHGVHLNTSDRLADSNVTLAKTLREAGDQTAAFVGAFPIDSRFRLNQGLDTYDGRFAEEAQKVIFSHRAGEKVTEEHSICSPCLLGWSAAITSIVLSMTHLFDDFFNRQSPVGHPDRSPPVTIAAGTGHEHR